MPVRNNLRKSLLALNKTATATTQPTQDYHEVTGDIICPSMVQGIDHLRDPRLNKVWETTTSIQNLFILNYFILYVP